MLTFGGASDPIKGAQGRGYKAHGNLLLDLGSSYILKIHQAVHLRLCSSMYICGNENLKNIYYIVRKKDVFSKGEGKTNTSGVRSSSRVGLLSVFLCARW